MDLKDKIRPKDTAIIVIDLQVDFASPDGLLGKMGRDLSQVEVLYQNLFRLLPIATQLNIPILYTKQIYDRTKLTHLQLEQYDLDRKFVTCDIKTDGHELYKIDPNPEDVYVKYNFNIFSNESLVQKLKDLNIKTLIVTGMDIIYCVETAIRNGFDLGYKIVVPRDLVAGNAKYPDLNQKTFTMVEKTYGVMTSTDEIIDIWQTLKIP